MKSEEDDQDQHNKEKGINTLLSRVVLLVITQCLVG